MKYWMVYCDRGHAGTGKTTEIKFAIAAENLMDALTQASQMPSVKHSRMPFLGREITMEDYYAYRNESAYERFPSEARKRNRKYNKKKDSLKSESFFISGT